MAEGDGGAGMGVIVGALLVVVIIIAFFVFGGGRFFGGTKNVNVNIKPPSISAPAAPTH